jgi:glycosyltransferase involved in cell wall biosynthesis
MQHAGIFVLPSENENFGITVAEAMAGGAAVVTTKQTAASEHVRRAQAGVVLDSPTHGQLASAIQSLLARPEQVADAGTRAHGYARTHLTWDAAATRLLDELRPSSVETRHSLVVAEGVTQGGELLPERCSRRTRR